MRSQYAVQALRTAESKNQFSWQQRQNAGSLAAGKTRVASQLGDTPGHSCLITSNLADPASVKRALGQLAMLGTCVSAEYSCVAVFNPSSIELSFVKKLPQILSYVQNLALLKTSL